MITPTAGVDVLPRLKSRPVPARYGTLGSLLLLLADTGAITGALLLAQALTHIRIADLLAHNGAPSAAAFGAILWLLLFDRVGMYRRSFSSQARDDVYASLAACAIAMLPTLAIFLILPGLVPFRHLLITALVAAAFGVTFVRYAAHALRDYALPAASRRIAVVGTPDRVAAVPGELSLTTADFVMRLPIDAFDADVSTVVASGDLNRLVWLQTAIQRDCREIIITEALPPEIMPALLRYTEAKGIRIAFAPMRIRPHACDFKVRRDGGLALLYPHSLAICTPGAELLRRVMDLAIAVPAVIVLSPLLGCIALAIFLDSGAPVLYRQTRVGRLGREFRIVKFRTMRQDAEHASGPVWARSGEDRSTRIGKVLRRTSLDELPQLFNVLSGAMSIVGPRPERPYYVEQFRKLLARYDERQLVRPGITGWSHVNMRRNVDTSQIGERLAYDLFYLEHWSWFMDLVIICKTVAEFLFHKAV